MSTANAKIAQKIEAYLLTMERLASDIRSVSTSAFENTMNGAKVTAVKTKLDTVEARLDELHTLMQEALVTSSDADVVYRSGGGGGK
jgi:division protein CdvB (Snf7/Vps24/ESCRT-III family)